MPKLVGTKHDHMLPKVENRELNEVWQCDCGDYFSVEPGGPAGKEKAYGWIQNPSPSVINFVTEEKVEAETTETEAGAETKEAPTGE